MTTSVTNSVKPISPPATVVADMYAAMEARRKGTTSTTMAGIHDTDGKLKFPYDYSCFGSMPQHLKYFKNPKNPAFFYIMQRLGNPSNTEPGESWSSQSVPGPKVRAKYFEYLLSEKSPWRSLRPFIFSDDPEKIAVTGLIFNDISEAPTRLMYNFWIANRFVYELYQPGWVWYYLVQDGVDPTAALLVANMMVPAGSETKPAPFMKRRFIQPYGGQHAFMSGSTHQYLGRFMNGEPNPAWVKDPIRTSGITFPVQELWAWDGGAAGVTPKRNYDSLPWCRDTDPRKAVDFVLKEAAIQKLAYDKAGKASK